MAPASSMLMLLFVVRLISGQVQDKAAISNDDNTSLHSPDDSEEQVNVARGVIHSLGMKGKLEEELCEMKAEVARLKEQVILCNSSRAMDQKYFELSLATMSLNMTSLVQAEISKCEQEKALLEKPMIHCSEAGKGLNLVNLTTGQYYFSGGIQFNWFNALKFCRSHGLDLVSIEDEKESKAVNNKLRNLGLLEGEAVWTSGTDLGQEGRWFWASTGQEFKFQNWYPNQPDNHERENCVHVYNYRIGMKWNDIWCSELLQFICELPSICK